MIELVVAIAAIGGVYALGRAVGGPAAGDGGLARDGGGKAPPPEPHLFVPASNVEWYTFLPQMQAYVTTAPGFVATSNALGGMRADPVEGENDGAQIFDLRVKPTGLTFADLLAQADATGSYVFLPQASVDAIRAGGVDQTPIYLVRVANLDGFLKSIRDNHGSPAVWIRLPANAT